jgi:hypothetical protein
VFDNKYNGKKKVNLYFPFNLSLYIVSTSILVMYYILTWPKIGGWKFPTGNGKSVCFQMVPLIHDAIYGRKDIGLVISPLKSLMIDQCKQFCFSLRSNKGNNKITELRTILQRKVKHKLIFSLQLIFVYCFHIRFGNVFFVSLDIYLHSSMLTYLLIFTSSSLS